VVSYRLKVNIAGVMPIIFAQAFLFIPGTIAQLFPDSSASGFLRQLTDFTSLPYNIVMFFDGSFIYILLYSINNESCTDG
jgi:preprotein translocase subunit SecY